MERFTVKDFFKRFPTDEACLEAIKAKRMGGERMTCAKCGRDARFYRIEGRRAYACQFCGDHFYPCVGTPFEDSRTSLQTWFYAMYLFTTTRHGVPAKELERQLGVTYKTAWRIARKLRELMGSETGGGLLGGDIEIDEAYFGGNKRDGTRGPSSTGKTVLIGMKERGGRVRAVKLPDARQASIRGAIEANVAKKGSRVMTDQHRSYKLLRQAGWNHESVNHGIYEYVRGDVHTNSIENFWGRLKASINGTHIHVSGKYLGVYAGEFAFRASQRHDPVGMFDRLLSASCRV
ncbi:MAG: IS1595 family transposase [Enhydrobacter sp.]|nr:MAG: IS1595 family transposase [Enhydrobacter sp.]